MTIEDIKAKIEEEKKMIADLEEKKGKLEKKISDRQKRVIEYEKMIKAKQYTDIDTQLDTLGVSREELLQALMSGNLTSLQNKIKNDGVSGEYNEL